MPHITRFPPEPNGYIHLGHLKAMMYDFDRFTNKEDYCILRMDDTNPETERQEFVEAIKEDVEWLGYHYKKLTYTSDYFDELFKCAIYLIEHNYAYVDFSSPEQIKDDRHNGIESPYRSSSVELNVKEFINMRNGMYKDNEAVLRLKIDMQNNNHSLRDPIAYRIKHLSHYRTENRWCIYPSYDYSHGIVDTLERVTDSYCTMEFFVRHEQYFWPIHKLKPYFALMGITTIPTVCEFGRLNIEGVELSKRKIIPLVENKFIDGFDDPRLYTIRGLRRRGFTPDILKNIIKNSTSNEITRNETLISKSFLEQQLRLYHDQTCLRAFAVMDPIKLLINNNITNQYFIARSCTHPNHPTNKELGSHETILTKDLYIEKSDFRESDSKDYYRLTPNTNKPIRLRYADFVNYVSHHYINDDDQEIVVKDIIPDQPKKIKGIIHWVNSNSPKAVFEIYESLYGDDGVIKNGSKINIYNGYVEQFVIDSLKNNITVFQFERLGYFKFNRYLDNNNGTNLPVFIQIIGLQDKYNG